MESTSTRKFLDSYLDSPIIRNDRDKVLLQILSVRAGEKITLRGASSLSIRKFSKLGPGYDFLPLEPENYAWLVQRLDHLDKRPDLVRALLISTKVSRHVDAGLGQWGAQITRPLSVMSESIDMERAEYWYHRMLFFEKFVNLIDRSRASGGKGVVETSEGGLELHGNEYIVCLVDHADTAVFLMSYQQCLMLKDMFYGRFNAILAASVLYPGQHITPVLSDCFSWALECLERYGNVGYELVKTIEALAKTNLTRKAGGPFAVDGPHDKMILEAYKKERKLSGGSTDQVDRLEKILQASRNMELDVELFGLQKLSGHPLVDPYDGGMKVRETSRRRIKYRPKNIDRLRNNFCRMYLEGFVRRKSAWPPLEAKPGAEHTRLHQLMLLNELHINVNSYPLEDWDYFRFRKHHEFNYFPNFLDLMDDKSISYYRDQFMATWDTTIKPRSNKRLLIEMLSRPEITVHDIVERVRRGDIPFSWMIVSLYPKEREFKLEPRMFGMMVFEMRAFFTCTEANIADSVFPNLPPQTMTLNKIEIQEMFQEVTADHGRLGGYRLYEEFDLSGWNGHFHDEVVDPISFDLEDMFGLPGAFSVIHHFFKQSVMSVRVKECPPDNGHLAQIEGAFQRQHESNVLWPDHDAGIEGLSQKNWTCDTYAMFDLAMQRFGLKYYLIGQADNQTCTAWVPNSLLESYPGGLKELANAIAEAANEECEFAGHELNLDETLFSTEVITYSKKVWVRGVEYYTSVKALSRVFPRSSSDFPSVVNSVGAIAGQCLAAAEECKDTLVAYWLSIFHTALYLSTLGSRRPVETLNLPTLAYDKLSDGMITCLLEYPGELGGLPVGHILGFLYKGGADPLSKAVGSCKLMHSKSKVLRRVLYMLKEGKWLEKDPDQGRLLDDPYSLPLKGARTPEMSILADSVARVKGLSKNKDIFEMISFSTGAYEQKLRDLLVTSKPLNPVLASDVLGLSLVGVSRTALKMFTSTQTIQSLLQGDEALNPCQRILSTGASQFYGLLMRLERVDGSEFRFDSAYHFTKMLRRSWLKKGEPDLAGVTVVSPVDLEISYHEPSHTMSGFKLEVEDCSHRELLYKRSRHRVYFGRATREHRSEHGYRIITASSPDIAIAQLSRIATQPGISEGFLSVLHHVAETRGNISLKETLPYLGHIYGGMIGHRYQSRLGHLSANILGFTTQASHYTLSTDTAPPISGGEDDYAVMVQEQMVAEIGIASLSWPFPGGSSTICLRTDRFSWEPVEDEAIELPDPDLPNFTPMVYNPMVYSPEVYLERSVTRNILPMINLMPVKGHEEKIPYAACVRKIWRQMNRSHIASAIADRGAGRIHLDLDIAEVSRIGAVGLVRLAALAVSQFSLDALFSRSEGEFRWTPLPVIMSLSRAISNSLSVYIKHPLVQKTIALGAHLRDSGLRYGEAGSLLAERVSRMVIQTALSLFNDPGSILYESPLVLFYDDPEGEAWRSLAHAYKRACLQAAAVGEIDMTGAYLLVRRNLTVSVMGKSTELGRSQRMASLIANTLEWAKSECCTQLTHSLSWLSSGKAVIMTQCALSEALRLARKFTPLVTPPSPPLPDRVLSGEDRWMTAVGRADRELAESLWTTRWPEEFNKIGYDDWTISRTKGRLYGFDSSVGYSYLPLVGLTRGRSFVMIGCGHAAGPATLLLGGASMCYGLDLKDDITPEARMTGQYTPTHVERLGLAPRFLRLGWGRGWDGDIRKTSSVMNLSSSLTGGLIWIIDIPLHSPLDLRSACQNILTTDPLAQVVVRVIGRESKALACLSYLSSAFRELSWSPVFRERGYAEGWILCSNPTGGGRPQLTYASLPGGDAENPDDVAMDLLGGGFEYLLEASTSGLSRCSQDELQIGVHQALGMVSAATGELEHRFTYKQWTDIVNALIVMKILQSPNPLDLIRNVLEHDVVTVTLDPHTIPKTVDHTLRRLMTRVVPRMVEGGEE